MKNYSRREFIQTSAALGAGAVVSSCASSAGISSRNQFDIVITGGAIIDGTGVNEIFADVGIRDGIITAIGNLSTSTSDKIIDASGMKVVPGFIDIHTHTDNALFRLPTADSKLRQGVTTEIGGDDGDSLAPMSEKNYQRCMNESSTKNCPFRSFDEIFSAIQKQGIAQNFASKVGLGAIREKIVGMDNRPATAEEMELMKRETVKAIEEGCFGASTGLEYTPGSFASTEELWEVMKAIPQPYRLYATHMRNEDNRVLEAIDEAIRICRNSGSRLLVSHLKASYKINWYKNEICLKMLEDAIAEGIEVHADRYPYIAYQTGLANLFPLWARDGGTEQFMKRLNDKAIVEKIRPETLRKINGLGSWDSVMIASVQSDSSKQYVGKTIAQAAAMLNVDPFEFSVSFMLKENGSVGMVGFGMDETGTEQILKWKNTIIASDGGAYAPSSKSNPHPRTYGTFPRAIAYYQKERNLCSLPEMIRKMTSLPAQKIGLKERGVIAQGKAADIVIFNYNTIKDNATFLNPHQFPTGIHYVIVNGVSAVENNVINGKLAGKVLKSNFPLS